MKKLLTYFFLLTVFVSYSQEINQMDANGKRHGKWMKMYERTDQIRYQGTFEHGKESGIFEFYKPSEEKKPKDKVHPFATKTYSKGSDLVEVNYFSTKGNLLSEGKMKGKERTGKWIYYHPDTDKLMMTENYENGKLDGLQITYFLNGKITKKSNYNDGKLNGEELIYGEDGSLLKSFTYKSDELNGMVKYYDLKGNITSMGTYKNNRKDGEWKTYEDGKLLKTEVFPLH